MNLRPPNTPSNPAQVQGMKSHQIAHAQKTQTGRLAEKLVEYNKMMIKKDEEVVRNLSPNTAVERRQYPESDFRKNFLPVLSGEAHKNLPPGYSTEQLRNDAHRFWMQIAGGPCYEVDVVEHTGHVAFTVPAMMDTSNLKTAQPKNHAGLRALNRQVLDKAQGLPHAATRDMIMGLERQLSTMTNETPVDEKEALNKVNKIREYYGLKVEEAEGDKIAPQGDSFMGIMTFD